MLILKSFFVDMKLKDSDGFNPEKYRGRNLDEQQVILILKDCLLTVQNIIDCFSGEIQKHPLFGRRPPVNGLQAFNFGLERSPGLPYDDRDELVRFLLKARGEL